jgi:hypothetical protein
MIRIQRRIPEPGMIGVNAPGVEARYFSIARKGSW